MAKADKSKNKTPTHSDDVFDYQSICTINTRVKERRKMDIGDIWSNSIRCLKCGDVIRSKNRHDFRWCSCKSVAVDGGSWYGRIIGDKKDYESLIVMFNDALVDERDGMKFNQSDEIF